MSIFYLTPEEIKTNFRIDPQELKDYILDNQELNKDNVKDIEDKIYKSRLRNSHKAYPREPYQNIRTSLYISIRDHWVLTPVELSEKDNVICDGLHRIAVAHSLYTHRPIPVIYKEYL
jgi:hypothetical protein